ncbi:MAG: TlpA disulfide reductase family protein [Phycisphaerales bacterium]|nr:TlpA disulfide reductase family protein [Phycisphaerales bacterium]
MKKILSSLLFVCAICLTASAQYDNSKIQVGQKAPDLSYSDPNGKTLVLSQINKGRIVLLDFWASWCGPCRRSNPALVKLYNEYKGKSFKGAKNGFTIVSVSLDKTKEAWVQAIQADNLVWPYHMSDLMAWQSKAAEAYGVQFVPQAFLIDADGKILGKYMTSEEAIGDLNKLVK